MSTRLRILPRWLYQLYLAAANRLRSNDALHRALFGYGPCPGSRAQGAYWDWTTLVLRKAIHKHLKGGEAFLDMGTGSVGVLAIHARLVKPCQVVAVDWVPEMVAWTRLNAAGAHVDLDCRCSDLFERIPESFDVIAFNPPYLDDAMAGHLGLMLDDVSRKRFSGGEGGGHTIGRFLREVPAHLRPGGRLLLGVNHLHISRKVLEALLDQAGFTCLDVLQGRWLPGSVYVLQPLPAGNALTAPGTSP